MCLRVRRCGTLSPSKSPLCPAGSPNLKLYENIRGEISARCHQWALKSGAVRSGISLATCEGYNYLDEVIRRRLTRTPRPLPQSLDGRFAHSLARSSRLMAPDDGQILRDLRSHPMTAVDFRRIALSLEAVEEYSHAGLPVFCVGARKSASPASQAGG